MKRMSYFVMALALVLGFTQCKKEQPAPQTEGVYITLNVENSGDRHGVDTELGTVTYQDGDVIYVGDGNTYIGTLTRQSGTFSGTINPEPADGANIHFYFVGGLEPSSVPVAGTTSSFTVNLSNQTSKLPVLSYDTVPYSTGTTNYSCELKNKCALVRFPLANAAGSVSVGGMHNEATISFGGTTGVVPTSSVGQIRLFSKTDTEKWAILLPQAKVDNAPVAIGDQSLTVNVPAITANARIISISAIENDASSVVNLSAVTTTAYPNGFTAQDGDILNGELNDNVKISIAEGASVTLSNAKINENGTWTDGDYAGITCEGGATIILEGTNTVKGFHENYPGIQAGATGTTLTIEGSGTLYATGGSGGAAGIGSGKNASCGDITINGGTIIATGGTALLTGSGTYHGGAGIGTGFGSQTISCGLITIIDGTVTATGGTNAPGIGAGQVQHGTKAITNSCGGIKISGGMVTAVGGENAAGIGSGYGKGARGPISYCEFVKIIGGTIVSTGGSNGAGIGTGHTDINGKSNCGDITITTGVTSVTATKGTDARDSIGRGHGSGTCGTVMFGDETIYDGSLWIIAPESGSAYGGLSFSITTVTNTDDTWVLQPE